VGLRPQRRAWRVRQLGNTIAACRVRHRSHAASCPSLSSTIDQAAAIFVLGKSNSIDARHDSKSSCLLRAGSAPHELQFVFVWPAAQHFLHFDVARGLPNGRASLLVAPCAVNFQNHAVVIIQHHDFLLPEHLPGRQGIRCWGQRGQRGVACGRDVVSTYSVTYRTDS